LAPCNSAKNEAILEEQGIKVWPGNSPDMKPIKKLWRIVKTGGVDNYCTTLTNSLELFLQYGSVMKYCSRLPKTHGINAKMCWRVNEEEKWSCCV